jgi:hypothetical protein
MKFWFSGEVDQRISEAFAPIMARVETKLNRMCEGRDYGDAVIELAIIPMILGPEHLSGRPERRLWQRKEQSADYRTIIDFESFRLGDDEQRERLLVANTVEAVRDLHRKAGKRLRGNELASDILKEFGLSHADETPAT